MFSQNKILFKHFVTKHVNVHVPYNWKFTITNSTCVPRSHEQQQGIYSSKSSCNWIKTSVEDYSKCWRGLSPDPLGSAAEEVVTLLSISSHTCSVGLRSQLQGGQSSNRILCPCSTCCGLLAVCGVALSCIRTIPRFAVMCVLRFRWMGIIGVFVCNNIPAQTITEPPPNWPRSLTQMSL